MSSDASEQSWVTVLDELEQRIASTEAALDADDIFLDAFKLPFTPPTNLGPLPVQLRPRAEQILKRQAETEQRLQNTIESTRNELSKATRTRGTLEKASAYRSDTVAQYFDSNA